MNANNTDKKDEKGKAGRPPLQLSPELVERLAAVFCTQEEIAVVLGCSVDSIARRDDCAEAFKKGRMRARASLRRLQWKTANDPKDRAHGTMQIWLGKNELGQRDRIETGKPGEFGDVRSMTDDQLDDELQVAERAAADAAARKTAARSVN